MRNRDSAKGQPSKKPDTVVMKVTLLCPENPNHTIGHVEFDGVNGFKVRPLHRDIYRGDDSWSGGAPLGRMDGRSFEWVCPACIRSGLRGASRPRRFRVDRLIPLLAAQKEMGLHRVSVRATAGAVERVTADTLGVWVDKPESIRRRAEWADLMGTRFAADFGPGSAPRPTRSVSAVVSRREYRGDGAPDFLPHKGMQ